MMSSLEVGLTLHEVFLTFHALCTIVTVLPAESARAVCGSKNSGLLSALEHLGPENPEL